MVRQLAFDNPVEGQIKATGENVTITGTRGSNLVVQTSRGEVTLSPQDVSLFIRTEAQAQDVEDKISISTPTKGFSDYEAVATDISGRPISLAEAQARSGAFVSSQANYGLTQQEIFALQSGYTAVASSPQGTIYTKTVIEQPRVERPTVEPISIAPVERETFFQQRSREREQFFVDVSVGARALDEGNPVRQGIEVVSSALNYNIIPPSSAPTGIPVVPGFRTSRTSHFIGAEELPSGDLVKAGITTLGLTKITPLDIGLASIPFARGTTTAPKFIGGGIEKAGFKIIPETRITSGITQSYVYPTVDTRFFGTAQGQFNVFGAGRQLTYKADIQIVGETGEFIFSKQRGLIVRQTEAIPFISYGKTFQTSPITYSSFARTIFLEESKNTKLFFPRGEAFGGYKTTVLSNIDILAGKTTGSYTKGIVAYGERTTLYPGITLTKDVTQLPISEAVGNIGKNLGGSGGTRISQKGGNPLITPTLKNIEPVVRQTAIKELVPKEIVRLPEALVAPTRTAQKTQATLPFSPVSSVTKARPSEKAIFQQSDIGATSNLKTFSRTLRSPTPKSIPIALEIKPVVFQAPRNRSRTDILRIPSFATAPKTTLVPRQSEDVFVRQLQRQAQKTDTGLTSISKLTIGIQQAPFIVPPPTVFRLPTPKPFFPSNSRNAKVSIKSTPIRRSPRTAYTPQLAAILLDIEGATPSSTITGFEFRPIPRKRNRKRRR